MVSRKLMGTWAFLDFCLLAAGAIALAFSIVWRSPNVLMNFVISSADLTAGTVLGVSLLATFVISIGAIIQRNHVTIGLVILNYILVADAFVVGIVGSFIWFYTLRERNNFHLVWAEAAPATRIFLQDHFQCCGYFNGTDIAEIGGTFCPRKALWTASMPQLPQTSAWPPSLHSLTIHSTTFFTTIYGFMAIVLSLLLASLCVIKKRNEDERFKRIDAKRGGRGFV